MIMHTVSLSLSDDEIAGGCALSCGAAGRKPSRHEMLDPSRMRCHSSDGIGARPQIAAGQAKPRVVVIGGGVGGATVAKYLAASAKTLEVSLIEPKARYTTCFFSNLYLAGLRSFKSLTHGYETLAERYGVNVIHDSAASDRSGSQDRPARERRDIALRPSRRFSRHRLQVRRHRRLRRSRDPDHAARLERRTTDASCCARNSKAWRTAAFS